MIGHAVLELLGAQEIPATSENYEVWLSYYLGEPPALRAEIDERLKSGLPFDDAVNEALHERYFSDAQLSAEIALSSDRMSAELQQMAAVLRGAGDQTSIYAKFLDDAASTLKTGVDAGGLQQVIAQLAAATADMATQNQTLHNRLDTASQEVEALRSSMARLRNESLTDGLTGIANRRMFDQTLRMRLAEAVRDGTPLCLMLCDIDHFKRFNDTWGHATGDQVLRFVGATLRNHARGVATAARYGGEEFALILPGMNRAESRELAEAVRRTIEIKRLKRKSTGEDLGRVTISGGIAELRAGDTPADMIKRADACLYASKRSGRNRMSGDDDPAAVAAA